VIRNKSKTLIFKRSNFIIVEIFPKQMKAQV